MKEQQIFCFGEYLNRFHLTILIVFSSALRLHLVDKRYSAALQETLYCLLMCLPQTEAFETLRRRLQCLPSYTMVVQDRSVSRLIFTHFRAIPTIENQKLYFCSRSFVLFSRHGYSQHWGVVFLRPTKLRFNQPSCWRDLFS